MKYKVAMDLDTEGLCRWKILEGEAFVWATGEAPTVLEALRLMEPYLRAIALPVEEPVPLSISKWIEPLRDKPLPDPNRSAF